MSAFIILSSVDSTNNYAMAKLHAGMVVPGMSFLALEQTAGKGQRGRQWQAPPGENITMSIVLQPVSYEPFSLSAAVALGCYDFIKACGAENVSIKWPNDLYIGDRKAGGILIENLVNGGRVKQAVAGIGINLNSAPDLPGAISLASALGARFSLPEAGRELYRHVIDRTRPAGDVMEEYNRLVYKRGQQVKLKQGSAVFTTTIREVSGDGQLITSDVMERRFSVGDVEFIAQS